MLSEPAASSPRWIDVAPERFPGWIASFGGRHGAVCLRADSPGARAGEGGAAEGSAAEGSAASGEAARGGPAAGEPGAAAVFAATDGAVARCHPPFPPV